MMSLFDAVTAKPGLGGRRVGRITKGVCECVYVCSAVSGRSRSVEKLGVREITKGGIFEIFLSRFNFPCFSKLKKFPLSILAPQNAAAFSDSLFRAIPHLVLSWLLQGGICGPQCRMLS